MSSTRVADARPTWAAALYHRGPQWDPERSLQDQVGIGAHLSYMRELLAQGYVLQAGPFHRVTDHVGVALVGMAIFGTDVARAKELATHDPAVQSQVMGVEASHRTCWHQADGL